MTTSITELPQHLARAFVKRPRDAGEQRAFFGQLSNADLAATARYCHGVSSFPQRHGFEDLASNLIPEMIARLEGQEREPQDEPSADPLLSRLPEKAQEKIRRIRERRAEVSALDDQTLLATIRDEMNADGRQRQVPAAGKPLYDSTYWHGVIPAMLDRMETAVPAPTPEEPQPAAPRRPEMRRLRPRVF